MKDNRNIYIFFIIMALVFWNPLSFHFLYSGKDIPVNYYKVLNLTYWLVFSIGISLIFLIKKGISSKNLNNIVFVFSFIGIVFSLMVLVNVFLGLLTGGKHEPSHTTEFSLIFPPNTTARYSTIEFDYEAKINSIGLRNNEVQIDKGNKYRILAFGDSWTFGWGVDLESSWPKQLEFYLNSKGYSNIEVINCGQGGQYTTIYKKYMAYAVPLLKPDLALVGVLQGDDLYQLYENDYVITKGTKKKFVSLISINRVRNLFRHFVNSSLGNIVSIFHDKSTKNIQSNWKVSANNRINHFNRSQRLNYEILEDKVKTLFETGNLNPGLLSSYVDKPMSSLTINQLNNIATQFAISEMQNDFMEMKEIADNHSTDLIFINLPSSSYTGHKVVRTPNTLIINEYLYNNNKIDSIYHSIAKMYDLRYIQLTEHFKALEDKNGYFYKYDGHPNERGYKEIAVHIGEQLVNLNILKKE